MYWWRFQVSSCKCMLVFVQCMFFFISFLILIDFFFIYIDLYTFNHYIYQVCLIYRNMTMIHAIYSCVRLCVWRDSVATLGMLSVLLIAQMDELHLISFLMILFFHSFTSFSFSHVTTGWSEKGFSVLCFFVLFPNDWLLKSLCGVVTFFFLYLC